jgi:hypothetical protein
MKCLISVYEILLAYFALYIGRGFRKIASTNIISCFAFHAILSGSPVTSARRILRLQMEKTASRYGG